MASRNNILLRRQFKLYVIIAITVLIIIILSIAITLYYRKFKTKNEIYLKNISQLKELAEKFECAAQTRQVELSNIKNDIDKISSLISTNENFESIDERLHNIITHIVHEQNLLNAQKTIKLCLNEIINVTSKTNKKHKIRFDSNFWNNLINATNTLHGQLFSKLKTDGFNLSEVEIRLIALTTLDLPIDVIALIMNYTNKQTIYNLKHKITLKVLGENHSIAEVIRYSS